MIAYCAVCRFQVPASISPLRCPTCGNPLEFRNLPAFHADQIAPYRAGLWRYAATLNMPPGFAVVTLGEGWTPLIEDRWANRPVQWKFDALSPTGSYKDRGVSVMVNWLASSGAQMLVDDSSGNAGASIACYAARAGLHSTIYVPESAPEPKKAQIVTYGAELVEVPGPRSQSALAAENATRGSREFAYASHAWHPAFVLGMMTMAWEIWEQGGGRVPDWLVAPVGNGGLLEGLWRGFQHLFNSSVTGSLPRLLAVQAEPYTPVVDAFTHGTAITDFPLLLESILADGIAISHPVRGAQVVDALRQSNGRAVSVSANEIQHAHRELARRGLFVEPTSATVAAALSKVGGELAANGSSDPYVVAVLTGHGLKAPPQTLTE